jgi:hypothetical protein
MCKKVGVFDHYFDGPSWFRYWAKLVGPTDGWAELGAVYMHGPAYPGFNEVWRILSNLQLFINLHLNYKLFINTYL